MDVEALRAENEALRKEREELRTTIEELNGRVRAPSLCPPCEPLSLPVSIPASRTPAPDFSYQLQETAEQS